MEINDIQLLIRVSNEELGEYNVRDYFLNKFNADHYEWEDDCEDGSVEYRVVWKSIKPEFLSFILSTFYNKKH